MVALNQETNSRVQRLRQALAEKELDGLLVSQPENRRYLSGFDGSAGFLLMTQRDAILATDFRYTERAKGQASGYEVIQITADLADLLPGLTIELNLRTLGFEAGHVTFAAYRQLTEILDKAQASFRLSPTDGLVESLRAIKEPGEIELITRAIEVAAAAWTRS